MSWFSRLGFNPSDYREGSQRERILQLLRDFEVVPLPFILRMDPRIAGHTALISKLRKEGFDIKNFERSVKVKKFGREFYEIHSFYELLYDPGTGIKRESQEETYEQE